VSYKISFREESWPSLIPFRIARMTWNDFPCIVVEIEHDGLNGRGEALGVSYMGEDNGTMLRQIEGVLPQLNAGVSREELQHLLPAGGARNAIDAALWDLEAQRLGRSVWEMAGVAADPIETVFTIGLEDEPEQMAAKATAAASMSLFKVKLDSDCPTERIQAIREARPDARLIVDVNEGWDFEQLQRVAPQLADLDVKMIEQPLPRDDDAELEHYAAPLPICADESCLHLEELPLAAERYNMINIKLDKTGGLTHGLVLAKAARARGLGLMVGCMGGTSLSMAPAHVLAQLCDFVDIDGPLLLTKDRPGGLIYERGIASVPADHFWGN